MKLKCIRTNCHTGAETVENHKAVIYHSKFNSWCIKLEPGVTGYESFLIRDMLNKEVTAWSACAGTPDSWDKLIIPLEEMERLRDILELLPV